VLFYIILLDNIVEDTYITMLGIDPFMVEYFYRKVPKILAQQIQKTAVENNFLLTYQ
jgi:hypothetical protein